LAIDPSNCGRASATKYTVTGVEQIAARDECSIRQVNMTISLAFLAPDLVKAAVEGRLPRGIGVTRLRDTPAEWSRQYAMLGLSSSRPTS
jgi:site-specific DNA recombinase